MSIKSKVLAAVATLTLVGGVGTAGVLPREPHRRPPRRAAARVSTCSATSSARTPRRTSRLTCCGRARRSASRSSCSGPRTPTRPWTGLGVPGTVATCSRPAWCRCEGAALRLHRRGPAELRGLPLQHRLQGPRANSNFLAVENQYSPFGVDSGLCMGVAATAFNDEGVTLQPCGVSAKTVWILDTLDQLFTAAWAHGYIPLINGSNTNFSQPFVLTYPNDGFPTDKPRPQLVVTNLTGFSFHVGNLFGTGANGNQLLGATFGELK